MKLLYVYRYGILGGVCSQIYNRLQYLNKTIQVELLFYKDLGGVTLFNKTNTTYISDNIHEITEIIRIGAYDIISVIDTPEVFEAIEIAQSKARVFIEVHTTTERGLGYLNDLRSNNNILKRLQCFIVPSKYSAKLILEDFQFNNKSTVVVSPNTVDINHFSPRKITQSPDQKIILWVGKIDEHKNWEGFLEIASNIKKQRTDCVFYLVGGKTVPLSIQESFLQMLDNLNLMEDVKWLPYVDYEYMPQLYSLTAYSGGIHVITSRNESFGMTMAEAILCECPVISSRVGALPEILSQITKNSLYEYGDYITASESILHYLDNPTPIKEAFNSFAIDFRETINTEIVVNEYLSNVTKIYN